MTSSTDLIYSKLQRIPDVDRMVGTFVKMVGPLAVVNLGDRSVTIPCVGFTPPVAGISVQVERRNGQLAVFGPAVALPAMGTIKATGTPKCTVTVGGIDYVLGYRDGYTPVVGDAVEVNWATGIIQGKVTVAPADSGSANPGGGGGAFSGLLVPATDSGQWSTSYNKWQGNNPRASDSVEGAWVYGTRVMDALKGATNLGVEIYLPLRSQVGVCNVGLYGAASLGGGWAGQLNPTALNSRSGWVGIDGSYAAYMRDNPSGISVTSGSGDNNWTGTQGDALSGALRFSGNR